MIKRISNSFSTYSSKPFIITKERTFKYSEAALISDSLAYSLISELDVNPGEIAAIQMESGIEFIFFILALWRIGAVPVPLSPKLNIKETEELIEFINPKIVIRKDEISLIQESTDPSEDIEEKEIKEDDKAVIIFTSGTSGKAKGVVLTYANLFASFENGSSVMNFNEDDRWLASLPFYHIGGFSIIARVLLSGAALILPDSNKTDAIEYALKEFDPTMVSLVSTQLKRLLEKEIEPNPLLRKVLLGGGFINESLLKQSINKNWKIAKVYGSSETSSFFTYIDCNLEKEFLSSSGKPMLNNQIEIRDDFNNVLADGKIGNIWLKGNSCSSEYFNNPEQTRNKFVNGWYNSGDYGWLNNEGYLYLSARRTDLIISGGENINPYEVEDALKELDYISDAVVFGEESEEWGHIVSAAVIINDTSDESKIKKDLKEKISSYKIPKKFYFMKELPRNELGKINKEHLKNILTSTQFNMN